MTGFWEFITIWLLVGLVIFGAAWGLRLLIAGAISKRIWQVVLGALFVSWTALVAPEVLELYLGQAL